jgi:hypothetical protein
MREMYIYTRYARVNITHMHTHTHTHTHTQTGASRLATLRSLKRVTVSKDGIIVNPKYIK